MEIDLKRRGLGLCVITEWETFCAKELYWQKTIGKFNLNNPLYSVIHENGTEAYLSEGKSFKQIQIKTSQKRQSSSKINRWHRTKIINHGNLGANFQEYNGIYYENVSEETAIKIENFNYQMYDMK